MRCILCDKCKKIVEDEQKIRVVTLARPVMPGPPRRADDPRMNDHIWTKELCPECLDALEAFMKPAEDVPGADGGEETSGDTE